MTDLLDADLIPDDLLAYATPDELEAYRAYLEAQLLEDAADDLAEFEEGWQRWLTGIFPTYVGAGFASHHARFWEWLWSIEDGEPADPFVAVWPRGGAKSTSAELGCVALGARRRRRYGLYICHESGTPICDPDLGWMTVDDHPTATPRRGDGFEVRAIGMPGAEVVTPEHRYWVRRMSRSDRGHGRPVAIDRGVPGWVEAKDLAMDCWIGLPVEDVEQVPASLPDTLLEDPEFWWLIGLWWGDGTLGGPQGHQLTFALSDDHPDVTERLVTLLDRAGIRRGDAGGSGRCSRISFWRPSLAAWLWTWKRGNSRKEPPSWVEQLPLAHQAQLLRGYVDADGWVHERGVTLSSVYLPGLLSCRRMLARLGVACTIDGPHQRPAGMIHGRVISSSSSYNVRLFDGGALGLDTTLSRDRFRDVWLGDGHLWSRVRSVSPVSDRTFVAIQTSTEDYVTHFGRSHNCATQDQADDHVGNVGSMLESAGIARLYPELARKGTGKFGNPKGWRRNRLWTADGFVLDALGLDTAARGVKLEDQRPDLFVLDDLDSELDTAATVERKITTLTRKLLPAGAGHAVTMAIQNLVHPDSIFARLVDGRAEFLARRIVSGPVPAVEGLVTERREGRSVIVAGEPTWAGQDLATCQRAIDEFGLTAFESECQHDVAAPLGGMFDHIEFAHCHPDEVPALVRCAVWVDPAVTDTDASDAQGIQADGLGADGTVYRLWSWEARTSPLDALCRAIRAADRFGALRVGVETDQGRDTWRSVFREAKAAVEAGDDGLEALGPLDIGYTDRQAGSNHAESGHSASSKAARAQKMLVDYETGANIVHVIGTHHVLERALRRFPKTKPFDLTDAAYWSWRDLRGHARPLRRRVPARTVA